MDEILIPYQVSKGMVITGSWFAETEEKYFWMRRFESEEERKQLYQAVYENDTWLKEMKPQVDQMLDREKGLHITRVKPSPRSIIR